MQARIGLPQGLLYYQYGPVWERFLAELGAVVVPSGETTRETLDCGSALDEICLPAKVYYGHAVKLYRQVDYLFVPRVVSVQKGQYTCPKIIGMPDLLRNNMESLPAIIDIDVNLRQGTRQLLQAVIAVGRLLGQNAVTSMAAWYKAWKARVPLGGCPAACGRPAVALIGHPYLLYDRLISMNVMTKLQQLGLQVLTPDMVDEHTANQAAGVLGKKIFWSSSHHLAGAALAFMNGPKPVRGIIFMTCFACGPDALIGELIAQRAQALGIPCMHLSIDEHTAEAGFVTRLEAFTDMLTRRWRA